MSVTSKAIACAVALMTFGHSSLATARPSAVMLDRVAARFVAPETGGATRPKFITERELAFFTRIEALSEQATLEAGEYPERLVRVALDRLVARKVLSTLFVQRGAELPAMSRHMAEARSELETRVGGAVVLSELMREEAMDDEALQSFLGEQIRAVQWVDRFMSPLLVVSDDALREAFRGTSHPFRGARLEDVRSPMARWLTVERFRAAELEFMQSARTRILVTTIPATR